MTPEREAELRGYQAGYVYTSRGPNWFAFLRESLDAIATLRAEVERLETEKDALDEELLREQEVRRCRYPKGVCKCPHNRTSVLTLIAEREELRSEVDRLRGERNTALDGLKPLQAKIVEMRGRLRDD